MHSDVVMSSLARCICILDRVEESISADFSCDICTGSGRKIDIKNEKRLEHIPEAVLRMATDRWKSNKTSIGS